MQQNEDGKFNKEGAYATIEKTKAVNQDMYNRFKAKLDGCSGKRKWSIFKYTESTGDKRFLGTKLQNQMFLCPHLKYTSQVARLETYSFNKNKKQRYIILPPQILLSTAIACE